MKRCILFCLTIVSVFSPFILIFGQAANTQDSLELVKLYNATNGDSWTSNNGWLSGRVATWNGISLDGGGRVKEIWLINNNLNGTLPNLILPNLERLYLANNALSGTIPNFQLPAIKILDLGNNQLNGSIADFDLPMLEWLILSQNHFSGSLPDFNLSHLKILRANNNNLEGRIPNLKLPELQELELDRNQFSGSIPSFDMLKLEYLYLSRNQLTGTIPELQLPQLIDFRLHFNQLSGTIPDLHLPLLQSLWLDFNKFSGSIPNFDLPSLNYLTAISNKLSGKLPDFSHTQLGFFWAYDNEFTFEAFEESLPKYPFIKYSPQAPVKIAADGSILSVSAGGTLANNTYHWFRNGQSFNGKAGDSTFSLESDGQYSVNVTNAVANELTLHSDTLTILNGNPFYMFKGNGNWDDPANWAGNSVPPSELAAGEIVINPTGDGECILNINMKVSAGAKLMVSPFKKFRINNNLKINTQ